MFLLPEGGYALSIYTYINNITRSCESVTLRHSHDPLFVLRPLSRYSLSSSFLLEHNLSRTLFFLSSSLRKRMFSQILFPFNCRLKFPQSWKTEKLTSTPGSIYKTRDSFFFWPRIRRMFCHFPLKTELNN